VGYSSLSFNGVMPARLFSHVRLQTAAEGLAVYDVTLLDESGNVVAEISEFMMKRLDSAAVLDAPAAVTRPHFSSPAVTQGGNARALELLEDAIRPEEGVEVFRRLLHATSATQVVVSPTDLDGWLAAQRQSLTNPVPEPSEAEVDPRVVAELLEAESALLEHPAVARATVTSRPDRTGDMRRVAYIVYDATEHATVSELRRYLKGRLMPHLVPSAYIELDVLPLLASGEIDQKALPDPFGLEDTYVAPTTPLQKTLAQIWQDVLGISRVGIHDNFFDIGGHSLLAMRVISKLDKKTGVRLDNAIMVLHTLEQIAAECERRSGPPQTLTTSDDQPADAVTGPERLSRRILNAFRQNAS
jgi:hypothetical protein